MLENMLPEPELYVLLRYPGLFKFLEIVVYKQMSLMWGIIYLLCYRIGKTCHNALSRRERLSTSTVCTAVPDFKTGEVVLIVFFSIIRL